MPSRSCIQCVDRIFRSRQIHNPVHDEGGRLKFLDVTALEQLAILGNTLFMNTLDMHVVAVDARTGHEIWKTEMGDYTAAGGYAAPGAPLVVKDKLIVGMAGGEHV